MIKTKPILHHLFIVLTIIACSKGVDQVDTTSGGTPRIVNDDSSSEAFTGNPAFAKQFEDIAPNTNISGFDQTVNAEENFNKAKENSQKPIIAKVGAAGIKFTQTKEEFEKLLSVPERTIPRDGYQINVYIEGMNVFFREQEPRVPFLIWLTKDYQGSMNVGGKIGEIKIKTDLSSYFGSTIEDNQGQNFVKLFYNTVQNKEEGYDCLATKVCEIKDFGDHFLFMMKSVIMLVSADRKLVADIRLNNEQEPGDYKNAFDIIKGEYEIEGKKDIKFGATYKYLEENMDSKGFLDIRMTQFTKELGSINAGFTKSKFDIDYKVPSEDEKLKQIVLYSNYSNPREFLVDTNEVDASGEKIKKIESRILPLFLGSSKLAISTSSGLVTSTSKSTNFKENSSYTHFTLKAQAGVVKGKAIDNEKQLAFIKSFVSTVESAMRSQYQGYVTTSKISNIFDKRKEKNYTIQVRSINKESGEGYILEARFNEPQGNFGYIALTKLLEKDLNQIVLKKVNEVFDLRTNENSLLGFKLGSKIDIRDIDIAREEANLYIKRRSELEIDPNKDIDLTSGGKVITDVDKFYFNSRVSFDESEIQEGVYDTKFMVKTRTEVATIELSDFGLSFNLVKGSENKFYITEIQTSSLTSYIIGLCNDSSQSVKIGMEDKDVLKIITNNFAKDCKYIVFNNNDGSGRIESIHFPDQNAKLMFSERELSSVGIYIEPKIENLRNSEAL